MKIKGLFSGIPPTKTIALVGIMAASISAGKLALSFLPNVEVVTLLIAAYSYVFGIAGVLAALVFVCIEPLIWGFGPWFLTYIIYWPALAAVFWLIGRAEKGNRWSAFGIAVCATLLFGVLSSLIEVALLTGITPHFFENFALFYVRGVAFYAVQTLSNAILFLTLFEFLAKKLGIIKRKMLY